MFRTAANKTVDAAHSRIASAEMMLAHSFTDEDRAKAQDELAAAQRYLQRACDARRAWRAADHDEYEAYPVVPYDKQTSLGLA